MALDPKKAQEYAAATAATAKSTEDIKSSLQEILFVTRDYASESREAAKAVFENSIQAGATAKAFRDLTDTTRNIRREFEDIVGGTKSMADISKDLAKLDLNRRNLLVEQEQAVNAIFTEYQFGPEYQEAINEAMGSTAGLQDALLKYGQDLTAEQQDLLNLYIEQGLALEGQDKDLEEIAKRAQTIDSAMRPFGDRAINLQDAAKGLSDGLGKAGLGNLASKMGIDEAITGTREMASSLTEGGTKALNMSGKMKLAGNFAKTLGSNLMASLGPAALLAKAIEQIVKAFKLIDGKSGEVAKNFGISAKEGRNLVSASSDAAAMSGDLLVSTKDVVAAQMQLNKAFGTSVQFSGEFAAEFASIQERTGLSAHAMEVFGKKALLAGTSIEDQLKKVTAVTMEMSAQSGVMISAKDIQEGIAEMSAAQMLTAKNNTKEIAKQVFQTKLLGVSQEQLSNMGQSLLDFESSIASEMEAELLIGKDLNLERARSAALQGDQATLAAELRKEVGTAAEFGEMNVIQQEALAKAFGMQREDMGKMLMEQEKLEAVKAAGFKSVSEAQDMYNKALAEGTLTEEKKEKLQKAGLLNQMESATAQDKMNAAMEKLTDLFVQLIDPLMPLIDTIMLILDPIFDILSPIFKLLGDISKIIMSALNPALSAISSLFGSISKQMEEVKLVFNGVGDVFMGIVNFDFDQIVGGLKKMGSGIIGLLLSPIQALLDMATAFLNSIIRGINKIPGVDLPEIPEYSLKSDLVGLAEGGIVTQPTKALIGEGGEPEAVVPLSKAQGMGFGSSEEIKQTNLLLKELISAVKQGGNVYMDSTKVGTAMAVGTYKVQ